MPLQEFFQLRFIEGGLLEHLFDACLVFGPAHAGDDGHDVFGAENLRGHAFIINALRFPNGLLGQSVGGAELHRESMHQQMLALGVPALRLQVCVDGREAGG